MRLEDILETIHEYTEDVIVVSEAEPIAQPGPRIVFVNKAFTKQTGYEPHEIVGQTPRILQGPDTDKETLARIREGLQNWRYIREEVLNYRKDGSKFWSELSILPVADEKGWYRYWVSIQRDVTAKRTMPERLELTIAASGDGIWDWNIENNELFWSDRFKEIVGVDKDEFVPHASTFFDRLPAADAKRVAAALDAHFEKGEPFKITYRLQHADGHLVDISAKGQAAWGANGKPVRMVGTVSDVSDLVKAHADLTEAQTLSGIAHWNYGPNPDQAVVSDLVWKLLRLPKPDKHEWRTFLEALGPLAAADLQSAITQPSDTSHVIDTIRDVAGHRQHIRIRFKSRSLGGDAFYVFGIIEDRTAAVLAEESLAFSERLAAFGQLAGGVAHDFNNILTAIGIGAESLELADSDAERDEIVDDVLFAVRQGQQLTEALLNYTRQAPLMPERFPLEKKLKELGRLASRTIPVGIVFETELANDLPSVLLDESGFDAAVLNLVINAADACEHDGVIRLSSTADEKGVYVIVDDNGPGIPEKDRSRVIEPFYSTKGGEGAGIGLARVHGFTQQSGGSLTIEESPLGGARMVMFFASHRDER